MPEQTFCLVCHAPLSQPRAGRPRVTCSHACRQKLYRHRHYRPGASDTYRRGLQRFRAFERRYGPLPWRVRFFLTRGIPINECWGCGRPFTASGLGSGALYCSRACGHAYRQRERALDAAVARAGATGQLDGRVLIRRRFGGVPPICPNCGLPFVEQGAYGPWRTYCSARCRRQAYEKRWERRHGRKRSHRYRPCPNCGRRFDTLNARGAQRRRFCSHNCKSAYNARLRRRRRR